MIRRGLKTPRPASVGLYGVIVDAGVAALVGAGVTGVVAITVQMLGGWMSARSLRVEARSARLTDYLSGTLGGVLAIGQVARAPMAQKLILERDLVWAYMDRSNNALSAIELHDAADLVAAVQTFDRAVAELMGLARGEEFDRQTWSDQRHALLDDKLAQLKQVGRRHVRGSDRASR